MLFLNHSCELTTDHAPFDDYAGAMACSGYGPYFSWYLRRRFDPGAGGRAAGAALHGAPVPVHHLDVVVTHGRVQELGAGLYRLGSDRWSERWKQWGPAPLDPAEPGAMRWRTLFGEVRVRLVDAPPESITVAIGDLTVAVRPLHDIEFADQSTARVLARLREVRGG